MNSVYTFFAIPAVLLFMLTGCRTVDHPPVTHEEPVRRNSKAEKDTLWKTNAERKLPARPKELVKKKEGGVEFEITPSFTKMPPRLVAVLPFINETKSDEAFEIVRKIFYNHFSSRRFLDVELFKVDEKLKEAGLYDPAVLAETSAEKLGDILGVDAVIRGKITKFDKAWALIYSQVAVGLWVRMENAKNGKVLWEARHVNRLHEGGISLDPISALGNIIKTAMNVRGIQLLRAGNDLARSMVATIPEVTAFKVTKIPRIEMLLHDGKDPLGRGGLLTVAMMGEPDHRAFFNIGSFKKGIRMVEQEKGRYVGEYRVAPGDNAKDEVLTAFLENDAGDTAKWLDVFASIVVDTIPPAVPESLAAGAGSNVLSLGWKAGAEKDLAGYRIYRSDKPLSGFEARGESEYPQWKDPQAKHFATYHYQVRSFDRAGNESETSDTVSAFSVKPGPSSVGGILDGKTVWYEAGGPYIIKQQVTVADKAVLTIEPGVEVRSEGGGILVRGTLLAKGRDGAPIRFVSAKKNPVPGNWAGIRFEKSRGKNVLSHCEIQDAAKALDVDSASVVVDHSRFTSNKIGALITGTSYPLKIEKNEFVRQTLAGIIIDREGKIEVSGNLISNNEMGILIRSGAPVISGNRVRNNKKTGIMAEKDGGKIERNHFSGNGDFAVSYKGEGRESLDARHNYWGTDKPLEIFAAVLGKVDLSPALASFSLGGKASNDFIEVPVYRGVLKGEIKAFHFLVAEESPYTIQGEVKIARGGSLVLRPGVKLKFAKGSSLVVAGGDFLALGEKGKEIVFTSAAEVPAPGDYLSALVVRSGEGRVALDHCRIHYASRGVDIRKGSPDISHCEISDNAQVGVRVSGKASPKIIRCVIVRNRGMAGIYLGGWANPKIRFNRIEENPWAVQSLSQSLIDAKENWWGKDPPDEDLFIGKVEYKPWLKSKEEAIKKIYSTIPP